MLQTIARKNAMPYVALVVFMVLAFVQALVMETLDLSTLINTDALFQYANILIQALGPVVLIGLGFALARYIIGFVQRIFAGL